VPSCGTFCASQELQKSLLDSLDSMHAVKSFFLATFMNEIIFSLVSLLVS
jgi:hypothetical protein